MTLRKTFPGERILTRKADVSDALRNVSVDPDKAHNVCYTVGDLVVIEFRLTCGWSGSPRFWGIMSVAAQHAHSNTTLNSTQLLEERKEMTHVKVVDRWGEGKPAPIPPDVKLRAHSGERCSIPSSRPCK